MDLLISLGLLNKPLLIGITRYTRLKPSRRAALEHAKVEELLELLRQKGINPDDLI
ncbi:MAG: hypothetical protein WCS37_13580 [Chloroflexota bacterium]|nr:hypothetical protein [Chloroflexota bacterium]